jgi:DNA-binding MarR family transcriptional regulator
MNEHLIPSKEDDIILRISQSPDVTQRELASGAGISLGMTNIILKRLVRKGYLKMRRLSRRNIEYVLTPEGLAHYSRRSYNYLMGTISSVRGLKERISAVVTGAMEGGSKGFVVQGEGELADIAELVLRDLEKEHGISWARGNGPADWMRLSCDAMLTGEEGGIGDLNTQELDLGQALTEFGS